MQSLYFVGKYASLAGGRCASFSKKGMSSAPTIFRLTTFFQMSWCTTGSQVCTLSS